MGKGFVIQLPSGEYVTKCDHAPVTDDLIFAWFFKTEKAAQQTLDRLRENNDKFDKATIRPVMVMVAIDI